MNIYFLAALRVIGYVAGASLGIFVMGRIICGPIWVFPCLCILIVLSGLYAWVLDRIKHDQSLK